MVSKRPYISVFTALSGFLVPGVAAAQIQAPAPDYSALIDAQKKQQEEEFWRPLFDTVIEENEGAVPASTAAALHGSSADSPYASHSAVFLPDDDGRGGILLVPSDHAFANEIRARGCQTTGLEATTLDPRTAAMTGQNASFALRGAPSECSGLGLRLASAGTEESSDVEFLLSPAVGDCRDGSCRTRGVKGEIRLGEFQDIAADKNGWYMYAAADGTRVTWDERPSNLSEIKDSVDVSDSLTMGDVEAGVMLSRGRADVSINYVHRRSKFQTWTEKVVDNADYVGVKVTFD